MKPNAPRWLLLVITLFFGQQATVLAAQFSADMVQTAGGMTQTMRYYMGDQKIRTEVKDESGQAMASIIDLKERKMLQLMPADKMYMEFPLGDETASWTWSEDNKNAEQLYEMKRISTENVNGYACDKYDLIPKKAGLEKSTTWVAKKLGYPIRTVGKGFSMELKNIREGAQPDSLFVVPKGYQKMSMPGFGVGAYGSPAAEEKKANGKKSPGKDDGMLDKETSDALQKGLRGLFGN